MRDTLTDLAIQVWMGACRLATYAMLNLLDDPAILAMAFC